MTSIPGYYSHCYADLKRGAHNFKSPGFGFRLFITIIIAIFVSVCRKYSNSRITKNLGVPYFVQDSFSKHYSGVSLGKVERDVEANYIGNLRNECYNEQVKREPLLSPDAISCNFLCMMALTPSASYTLIVSKKSAILCSLDSKTLLNPTQTSL